MRVDRVTVATIDEAVVGFVMVHDDEIEHLYVDPARRRLGVASVLLRHAEAIIAARSGTAWLAVVPSNLDARAFYERHGWRDMGRIAHRATLMDGAVVVSALRYEKDVVADLHA